MRRPAQTRTGTPRAGRDGSLSRYESFYSIDAIDFEHQVEMDDDGSLQRSVRTRTVRADPLSRDSEKMPRSIERPSGQTESSHKRDRVVGPSGHTIACGGSAGRAISGARGRHPQEFEPERAVFLPFLSVAGTTSYADSSSWPIGRTVFSSSGQPRTPRSAGSWTGSALLGRGSVSAVRHIVAERGELRLASLSAPSRWRHTLAFLKVPGGPRVPRPGLTVESRRDRVVRRAPRKEARTEQ